ncbi:MAG: hypothetical protein HFE85_02335 [Clostridiales bacterium]|nr:hypothetical protein [Clostridiales bacterium]
MKKRILSLLLSAVMLTSMAAGSAAPASAADNADTVSSFRSELSGKYADPDREFSTEVRWWLGSASATDETLLEEIQAMYDGGFRGAELCMQSDKSAPNDIYAYGSEMWSHKWKLMMNKMLDLGMTVSLTSGTNWSTSNVPGLDPDSQAAMQCAIMGTAVAAAGDTVAALPVPSGKRDAARFIGVYAYRLTSQNTVDESSMIDLTAQVSQGETVWDQGLSWTVPADGNYQIFALWTQGTAQASSPSQEPSYCTNYFDTRGVEALKSFWEAHILDDPELNQKILDGDVNLFMDSLEMNTGKGFTWWSEDMAQVFEAKKGYDIRPYLFLISGVAANVRDPYHSISNTGTYRLDEKEDLRQKIVQDYQDILTELYMERMLLPMKEWLNSVGIETRAQISYGKPVEISEPIMAVDYPEAEQGNQNDQVDIYRLWSGGAKLQNKVLSSETGTPHYYCGLTHQRTLRDAYCLYAAGYSRMIWHIWTADYGYGNYAWPGYVSGIMGFARWSNRQPSSMDYDELNAHTGRIQQLLREGKSRTDIGFIHNNWTQGVQIGITDTCLDWMEAHQGVYYRSTELQDNGYTYDYFSPEFLFADDVYFDEETGTIEQAGYKAIVIYQNALDVKGAEKILDWAKKGLKVVILGNAASSTPFNDGKEEELAAVMAEMKSLPTVRCASVENYEHYFEAGSVGYKDDVYDQLQDLGVRPYAEFIEPNHQLLTQSREDENGNMYLYAFNYCDGSYHDQSWLESVRNEHHGLNIRTEIKMDGMFVPYQIDAWSGEVTELANYRYENGQTVFPIDLDYANIALFAFEKVADEKFHVVDTNAKYAYVDNGNAVIRATESGNYYAVTSGGSLNEYNLKVPAPYDIMNWDVTVESWTADPEEGDLVRTETIRDVTTVNRKTSTVKTPVNFTLDKLATWDNIPEVGIKVSGTGRYEAAFNWDASKADGAYLDFGNNLADGMKLWINGQKVGGDISTNPTKVQNSVGGMIDGKPVTGKELSSGGISWTNPAADISQYLQDGENTIVIEYHSGLTNVLLDMGIIKETFIRYGFWGNDTVYRSYGPSQAVIVPYVEKTISAPEAEPVKSASAPASAQVNAEFDVTVVTSASVTDVRLFNENNMAIGRKAVDVVTNEDGTKTWTITTAIGTVGDGRTLKVVTKGAEGYLIDSGKTLSINITSVPPVLNSFDLPDSAVANRTFIVKATTDMEAAKITVYNEYGMKMGLKSLSYKIVDGQKEWTAVMSIGTKGERTFTAYAVNKFGAQSDALTDNISVKAFA